MARRSRISLLSRAAAIVFGDAQGSHGETGWLTGSYTKRHGQKVHVCLNAALSAAERDVFLVEGGSPENGSLVTTEAVDAQVLLASTILEQYPGLQEEYGTTVANSETAHQIIVSWNDNGDATADQMEDLLWKTETKAYDQWLADRPSLGIPSADTFIDVIQK